MNSKQKLIQLIYGQLLTPVQVGRPVSIIHNGNLIRTTAVQDIKRISPKNVVFETGDSLCCVVPRQPPSAVRIYAGATAV